MTRCWPLVAVAMMACSSDPAPTPQDTGTETDTEVAPDTAVDTAEDTVTEEDTGPTGPREVVITEDVRISSLGDDEHFQTVDLPFDFGEGPFSSVTLHIDLRSTCYPFEDWSQPPAGHNWPADCDAFDRNFEMHIDPPVADGDPPAIEVIRAITPFGGPLQLETDLTDLANAMPGEHTLRIHITTWSDSAGVVSGSAGGWNVGARLEVEDGPAPRNAIAVVPVYDGNIRDSETVEVAFTMPEETYWAELHYRTTGHGGANDPSDACIGPAEEFCQRRHVLSIDGRPFDNWIPWRDDCAELCTRATASFGQYCAENPCGAIQSVEAPRANWCPGSETPPDTFELVELLEPGDHTLGMRVDGLFEGGSWRTSAAVYVYGE